MVDVGIRLIFLQAVTIEICEISFYKFIDWFDVIHTVVSDLQTKRNTEQKSADASEIL